MGTYHVQFYQEDAGQILTKIKKKMLGKNNNSNDLDLYSVLPT